MYKYIPILKTLAEWRSLAPADTSQGSQDIELKAILIKYSWRRSPHGSTVFGLTKLTYYNIHNSKSHKKLLLPKKKGRKTPLSVRTITYQCFSSIKTWFTSMTLSLNHLSLSAIFTSFPLICLFLILPSSAKVQSSRPYVRHHWPSMSCHSYQNCTAIYHPEELLLALWLCMGAFFSFFSFGVVVYICLRIKLKCLSQRACRRQHQGRKRVLCLPYYR